MAKQKYMMTADDIAEELNCSKSYAYKVIRTLNSELNAKGFFVKAGCIRTSIICLHMPFRC